jgi:hypothetical protein
MGPLLPRIGASGSTVRAVGALRRDTWTGGGAIELRLTAAEPL